MDNKQIKWGAILSYLATAFNIIAGIIYTPWMIREIGQADYGIYGVATSVIAICTMDLGLGTAISRFISKFQAEKREDKVEQFIGIVLKLYLLIDMIILSALVVIFFLLQNIYVTFSPEELHKLKVVFVIVGSFTVFSFPFSILNGIITAREKFIFQKCVDIINKVGTILIMVLALSTGGGLYALVLVNAFMGCVVAFIKLFYLKKHGLLKLNITYWDKTALKEIFSFSIWITVILILQRFILNITPTILGITSGAVQISIFTAAVTIEGYAYTLTGALSGLFLPKVSKIYYGRDGNIKDVEELLIKVGRIQLLVIGAVCAIFFSVGQEFINLWLGENFDDAYFIAMCLLAPLLVMSTQGIADVALTARGENRYRAIGLSVTAFVAIALSFILSIKWGAKGSAIGIFFGYLIGDIIVQNIIYSKKLQINIKRFFVKCHMSMVIPIMLTFICGILMRELWYGKGWIFFIVKCTILTIIYLVLMWIIALNSNEKAIFGQIIKRFRK